MGLFADFLYCFEHNSIWNKSDNFKKKRKINKKMDTTKMISKDRLRWKCREHPNVSCELICLNGDAKERVMCFNCVSKH